eukprot:16370-Eustigmatos_ZCMA.PRE.1
MPQAGTWISALRQRARDVLIVDPKRQTCDVDADAPGVLSGTVSVSSTSNCTISSLRSEDKPRVGHTASMNLCCHRAPQAV